MLYGLILTAHIALCLILIAVILLQAGRGGGLADAFGGGAAQSIMGTRGTAYLTRATSVCAALFMLTSLSLAILSVQRGRSLMREVAPVVVPVRQQAPEEEPAEPPPPEPPPAQPAAEAPQPQAP